MYIIKSEFCRELIVLAKEKLFNSSFMGYSKDDVMKYIENMDIQYSDAKAELEGEIKELKSENEQLKAENAANETLKRDYELLKAEKDSLEEAIKAQGDKLSELQKCLDDQKTLCQQKATEFQSKLDVLEKEKSLAAEENKRLSEHLSELREENRKIKSQFDEKDKTISALEENLKAVQAELEESVNTSEIEEILEKTRAEARQLIERAQALSEKIVSDAKEKAMEETKKTISESNQIVKTNIDRVKYLTKKKSALEDIFKDHKSKVDSFFNSISDSFKDGTK